MRRIGSDTWVLIGLAAFIVAIVLFFGGRQRDASEEELSPRRTTYSAKRGGLKALYTTLRELGYPVRRHLTALTTDPQDGVLFIVSPDVGPSESEWVELRSWVERGNVLILAGQGRAEAPFGVYKPVMSRSVPVCPSFLSGGVKRFEVAETERIASDKLTLKGIYNLAKPFG